MKRWRRKPSVETNTQILSRYGSIFYNHNFQSLFFSKTTKDFMREKNNTNITTNNLISSLNLFCWYDCVLRHFNLVRGISNRYIYRAECSVNEKFILFSESSFLSFDLNDINHLYWWDLRISSICHQFVF